jgi:hypothetical protein
MSKEADPNGRDKNAIEKVAKDCVANALSSPGKNN